MPFQKSRLIPLLTRLVLGLSALLIACSSSVTTPKSPGAPSGTPDPLTLAPGHCEVSVDLEVDPSFTQRELVEIQAALEAVNRGTGNRVCIDPTAARVLKLIRNVSGIELIQYVGDDWKVLAGLWIPGEGEIHLVVGVLQAPGEVYRVMMHEFLHSQGIDHAPQEANSIMTPVMSNHGLAEDGGMTEYDRKYWCSKYRIICHR